MLHTELRVNWAFTLKTAGPVLVFLLVLLAPTPPDLSATGQRVLAVLALAVGLWSTGAVPVGLTALLAVVLLLLARGVADFSAALSGFSNPTPYFLLGVLTIGLAVVHSGLAERVGHYLVARARGRHVTLYGQMVLSFVPLTFVLPSAATRGGIMIPVYDQVLRLLGLPRGAPLARAIMLAQGSLNRLASTALLTGGIAPMTAAALIGGFSWTRWFVTLSIPIYSLLAVGSLILMLLYRPAWTPSAALDRGLRQGAFRLTGRQVWTSAIVGGASILWLTDDLHGLHPAVPALIAAGVILLPGVGLLTWDQFEREVGWGIFFVLGASISLGRAIVDSGAAQWLASWLVSLTDPLLGAPLLVVAVLVLVGFAIRLLSPNIVPYLTLMIPITMSFAQSVGLNPLVCALAVTLAGDGVVFYPAQGVISVVALQTGHFTAPDVTRLGLLMAVAVLLIVLFVALPYWSLIGQPLVP